MFREMRRNKQALSEAECREILGRCTSGTLAVLGDEGYPYAVPLSYVFHNGHIYFHCARSGHKLDAVRACDKVSFCVIDRDEVIPEKFTTKYRSVIVFGRAREVTDPEEIVSIMRALAGKYSPDEGEDAFQHEMRSSGALCVLALDIEHLSGKQGKELLNERKNTQ
ncbi:MAG: pyridoxamine 5'-phosphate oxidase family protein [Oscillospiraceae bacterium]|nr:pyridoxamine 5'-phosphate oxidase family protein [Oscillospiraceae bacterium]MBR7074989.1 pyridoxamine 5'-phosphate oxidase family protein [Oscillospiraceae bacterium]